MTFDSHRNAKIAYSAFSLLWRDGGERSLADHKAFSDPNVTGGYKPQLKTRKVCTNIPFNNRANIP